MVSDLERLSGPDRRVGLGWVPIVAAVILGLALILTWPPAGETSGVASLGLVDALDRATVSDVIDAPCTYAADMECRTVAFTLTEGSRSGSDVAQEFTVTDSTPAFEIGDRVFLARIPDAQPGFEYQFSDRNRIPLLAAVGLLFAAAVVALGRSRGVAALIGLALSVVLLVGYVVPAIAAGSSPVVVSLVGAGSVALLALYLAHGFTDLTHVAFIGTAAALVVTFGISVLVVEAARFSGFATEESLYLAAAGGVDIRGLLLAGIVLGTLGALDDVTVTQASAVWELRRTSSGTWQEIARPALRIGRDHIASTVNTLLLAYAGASLPLLLLFSASGITWLEVSNSEIVAVEIVRTLVGSVGLVLAVPVTTYLAALVSTRTEAP